MKELREYQKKIVNKVLASNKDTLIALPTGGGKTVIATAIMQGIKGSVVFVVPRLELIKQAKTEFADLGDVDIIWSNKTNITGSKYIIASKDTLRSESKKKLLPEHVTMIIDEVHVSIEASWKLVNAIKPDRVIGLTATPERKDGKALMKGTDAIHKYGIFDEIVLEETVPSLICKGFLSPLHYYAKPIDGITDIKPDSAQGEELSGSQMCRIFDDNGVWGDLVASYEQYGKGRPALGFTTTIAMAETVAELFQNAGYDFRVIHGGMNTKERSELINMLATGQIAGLVNAELLTYGFDCPCVSYAFSCRHIKSRPLWFQIVGRILRICEGKEDAIFVDHGDTISEFADPSCSLPIMDPFLEWKYNGETKEAKAVARRKAKQAQEDMKVLQELDPLPVDMIEVKAEDTYERMMRIIRKQKANIEQLTKNRDDLTRENQTLRTKNEQTTTDLIRVKGLYSKARAESKNQLQQIQRTNSLYQQSVTDLYNVKRELSVVQAKNNELMRSGSVKLRQLTSDETFQFVRMNYAHVRSQGYSHEETVNLLRNEIARAGAQPDFNQFMRGINYWKDHYR